MTSTVYLSGEIHTYRRDEIKRGAAAAELDVVFTSAVADHEGSDLPEIASTHNPMPSGAIINRPRSMRFAPGR